MENLFICPPVHRPLVVKLTSSGATVLKSTSDTQFKQRVQGSKSHTLLANAVLIENGIANPRDLAGYKKPTGKKIKKLPAGRKLTDVSTGEPVEVLGDGEPKKYRLNKKLIRGRIFAYLLTQKKPVAHFVTISFPQTMTDDGGYQALNAWLTYCRKYLHLREYLFVAERQKNGTIHFHLLVPQFLNVQKANRAMAGILKTMIRRGKLDWNIYACKKYNGVDLAKNRKTKRVTNFALQGARKALTNYILKYISKNDEAFTHYAWHNSRGFSAMMLSVSLTEAEAKYLQIRAGLDLTRIRATEYAFFVPWAGTAAPWFTELLRTINRAILEGGDRSRQLLTFNPN